MLKNYLFISQFDINLILISCLISNNFKILFSNNVCNIFKQDALITKANHEKKLYLLFIISKMQKYSKAIYSVIANNSIINNTTVL